MKKKKRLKLLLLIVIAVPVLLAAVFGLYVSDYYRAEPEAVQALETGLDSGLAVKDGNLIILHGGDDTESALIFYPGAKVEATAYYPLLLKIAEKGITCVLVKMPFHLAFFDSQAAGKVYEKLPDIKNWFIGGHSLGGAMASSYMSKHPDQVKGLVLLGAYIYGDVNPQKALTLYGTKDLVLNRSKITYTEHVFPIEGGNHAQFGCYGEQKGDGQADISREEQQEIAAKEITDFINSISSQN